MIAGVARSRVSTASSAAARIGTSAIPIVIAIMIDRFRNPRAIVCSSVIVKVQVRWRSRADRPSDPIIRERSAQGQTLRDQEKVQSPCLFAVQYSSTRDSD